MDKQSQRGFVAYAIMITIGVILVGGGFYYYSKKGNSFSSNRQEAMARLNTETTTLYNMKARYKAEREIISKIKDQYSGVRRNVLIKTDIFFNDADSENPQIKIKISDKAVRDEINKKRLQITKLLKEWEIKNEIIDSDSLYEDLLPTINDLVKNAEQDMAYIKQYMKELQDIIGNLSPTNSNFTQSQIDSYESIIEESAEYIQESVVVINNIQTEIPLPIIPIQTVATGTSTATSTTGSVGPSTNPPVIPPIITQAQINEQERVVAEAEAVVNPPAPGPATTTPTTPPVQSPIQIIWAPAIIYYLPPSNIDYTGWPDMTRDTTSNKPLLLQGSD